MLDNRAITFFAFSFFVAVMQSQAATITLSENTVFDGDPSHGGDTFVVIDGATPPTVVDIIDGANLQGDDDFPIFDLYGSSVAHLRGGFVGFSSKPAFQLNEHSTLIVSGGVFQGECELTDESRMRLIDGDGGRIRTRGQSSARFDGGQFDFADAFGESRIVMNGGFTETIVGHDVSEVIIRGGSFTSGVLFEDKSQAMILGGDFIDNIMVTGDSILTWRGGQLAAGEILNVEGSGVAHLYGHDLKFVVDDEDGPMIVGTWADGTGAGGRYIIRDQGQIILHEVPEPGAWGLAVISALILATGRRLFR